jgi:hypothetical protein
MPAAQEIPSESVRTYVRTARRLRHRLRHAPATLHRSLRTLRQASPVTVRPVSRAAGVFGNPGNERFSLLVRYSLVGSLLPHSTRQALLRKAARMGIRRFDANLIIAMVQHQAGGGRTDAEREEPRPCWVLWVALGVQLLIGIGVYSLLW